VSSSFLSLYAYGKGQVFAQRMTGQHCALMLHRVMAKDSSSAQQRSLPGCVHLHSDRIHFINISDNTTFIVITKAHLAKTALHAAWSTVVQIQADIANVGIQQASMSVHECVPLYSHYPLSSPWADHCRTLPTQKVLRHCWCPDLSCC